MDYPGPLQTVSVGDSRPALQYTMTGGSGSGGRLRGSAEEFFQALGTQSLYEGLPIALNSVVGAFIVFKFDIRTKQQL